MTGTRQSVGHSIAIGAVWLLMMKFASRVLGIVSTVILARLLQPEDFGLVAIAMSFFAMIAAFAKFGFDTALIQNQSADASHYNTAWTLNLVVTFTAGALLCIAAPSISEIYDDQRLLPVVLCTALLFLITGTQNIGVVDFRKHLRFDKEFVFSTTPRFIGFAVTIPLAFLWGDYWALVVGMITIRLSTTVLSYVMHPFRPRFSLRRWHELFHFSKWLLAIHLVDFVNTRAPELIVGKLHSVTAAGFISIAKELPMAAVVDVVATINRAAFPGYSKISDNAADLKALYEKVMGAIAIYVLPASIGLAFCADPIVPVFLGDKWIASIPLVEIMAIAGLFMALNNNTIYVFLAKGNPRLPAVVYGTRVAVLVPALLLLTPAYGLVGAALAVLCASIATTLILAYMMVRHIGLSLRDMFDTFRRPTLSTTVMFAVISHVSATFPNLITENPIAYVLVVGSTGSLAFALTLYASWHLDGKPDGAERKVLTELSFRASGLRQKLFERRGSN